MKRLLATTTTLLLLAAPASALADDTKVDPATGASCVRGGTCKTIAAAIDVSQAADSVTVGAGTYVENVTADVPDLLLRTSGVAVLAGTLTVPASGVTVDGLAILKAAGDAPAVSATGADLELIDSAVGTFAGPAVRMTAGTGNLIRRSTISGTTDGVQLEVSGAGARRLTVDSSVVLGGAQSAAYRVTTEPLSGAAELVLNHVTTAGQGGGIVLEGAGSAGGVVAPGNITANVANSIVHGASSAARFAGQPPLVPGNTVALNYTNSDAPVPALSGGATSTGGGTVTPDSELFGENLRLRKGSPAIDKGTLVAGESDLDIDGDPRTVGSASDLGADEYLNHAPTLTLAVLPTPAQAGQNVTATATAADREGRSDLATYTVDWGDGTPKESGPSSSFTHAYAKPGDYTVAMTVTDRSDASATASAAVKVVDDTEPQVLVTNPKEGATVALSGKRVAFAVKGVFADPAGVSKVEVALLRRTGGCAHFDGKTLVRRGCKELTFVPATIKGPRFTLKTPLLRFKPGNYQVRVRATDTLGNVTKVFSKAAKTLVTFKVS